MTALAAERSTKSRAVKAVRSYLMGTDIIYKGGLVMIDSNGVALAAAASASNHGCVGVARQTVDNSGGASDVWVEVEEGEFLLAGDTLEQADVGEIVYAQDDETVDETQGANEPIAGILTEYVSASSGWVLVSAATAALTHFSKTGHTHV